MLRFGSAIAAASVLSLAIAAALMATAPSEVHGQPGVLALTVRSNSGGSPGRDPGLAFEALDMGSVPPAIDNGPAAPFQASPPDHALVLETLHATGRRLGIASPRVTSTVRARCNHYVLASLQGNDVAWETELYACASPADSGLWFFAVRTVFVTFTEWLGVGHLLHDFWLHGYQGLFLDWSTGPDTGVWLADRLVADVSCSADGGVGCVSVQQTVQILYEEAVARGLIPPEATSVSFLATADGYMPGVRVVDNTARDAALLVSGQVVNAFTDAPMAAKVEVLAGAEPGSTTSGADGRYGLTAVVPNGNGTRAVAGVDFALLPLIDEIVVRAEMPGCGPGENWVDIEAQPAEVRISGRVLTYADDPVEGASVRAEAPGAPEVVSGTDGRYELVVQLGGPDPAEVFEDVDLYIELPDVYIKAVEVTQAIQCLDSDLSKCDGAKIPLVRGKVTAVRVYPAVRFPPGAVMSNTLRVGARLTIIGPPGGEVRAHRRQVPLQEDPWRLIAGDTVNFRLPADVFSRAQSTLEIELEVDPPIPDSDPSNNVRREDLTFSEMPDLKVWYVPVRMPWPSPTPDPGGPTATPGPTPTPRMVGPGARIDRMQRFMKKIYPVSLRGLGYRRLPGLDYPSVIKVDADDERFFAWLNGVVLASVYFDARGDWPDQVMAWLPEHGSGWAISDPIWGGGTGFLSYTRDSGTDQYAAETMAHEIAHNLGQRHPIKDSAKKAVACGAVDANTAWPYTSPTIQEIGFDLFRMANPVVPASTHDVMSYCDDQWISPYTYRGLYDARLRPVAAMAAAARGRGLDPGLELGPALKPSQSGARDVILIQGAVDRRGAGRIDRVTRVVSDQPLPPPPDGADYRLLQLAADGQVHAATYFGLSFLSHRGQELDEDAFFLALELDASTQRLRLAHGERTLDELVASANPPQVTVTAPRPGQAWDGTVAWTASDADGDWLTYDVSYSHDGGQSWVPLAADLEATRFTVDLGTLAGGDQAQLRVRANDGFHTGSADVAPLSVPDRPPVVAVLEPPDGSSFMPGTPVLLLGSGQDPEDGLVDDAAMRWSSDLDGDLGAGAMIELGTLSRGTHRITLAGRDAGGREGRDSITVRIEPERAFLPLGWIWYDRASLPRPPTARPRTATPTVTPSPTPTVTRTPTVTLTPSPSPTTTETALPLPPTATVTQTTIPLPPTSATPSATVTTRPPAGEGIHGRVTEGGAPAAGVTIRLERYEDGGGDPLTMAEVVTDADGRYSFTQAPSLGAGSFYGVRFGPNGTDPTRLATWFGPEIRDYVAGQVVPGGDFDIADVEIVAPAGGETVKLPVAFSWLPRGLAGDVYRWRLFDPTTQETWESADLGAVDSYELVALPDGVEYGKTYGWTVTVRGGPDSFGVAHYYHEVTFEPDVQVTCTDVMANGDFEGGMAGWRFNGEVRTGTTAFTRGRAAILLGGDDEWGQLWQAVTVPEDATAAFLTYQWYQISQESTTDQTPYDTLSMLTSLGPSLFLTHEIVSNITTRGAWRPSGYDLTGATGTFDINFEAESDDSNPSRYFVDDVRLVACTGGRPPLPSLVAVPAGGPVNTEFRIQGSGFQPREEVTRWVIEPDLPYRQDWESRPVSAGGTFEDDIRWTNAGDWQYWALGHEGLLPAGVSVTVGAAAGRDGSHAAE